MDVTIIDPEKQTSVETTAIDDLLRHAAVTNGDEQRKHLADIHPGEKAAVRREEDMPKRYLGEKLKNRRLAKTYGRMIRGRNLEEQDQILVCIIRYLTYS